jgi:hypothetical protein
MLSSITGVTADDSGDILIRLYETAGYAKTADLFIGGATRFWESDIYGNALKEMESNGEVLTFTCREYEIKNIRVHRK